MSYGFTSDDATPAAPTNTVKLPPVRQKPAETSAAAPAMARVVQAGTELGFVSRDTTDRRRPGPKRKEPQDRISIAGPKRVLDRLKAYCDGEGGLSYCEAISVLLDMAEAKGKE